MPLVVAGDTEDKPEIAARVAWTGAGINLRTGSPAADQIRDAVQTILKNPSYHARATAIGADIRRTDALARIVAEVEAHNTDAGRS